MSLVRTINGLINDIGRKSDGNIKGRLIKLRQTVEAQESSLKDFKAKVVELEAQAKKKKLAPKQRGLDKSLTQVLQLIAKREALTVRQIAEALGVPNVEAEDHKNVLRGAGMIEAAGEDVDEVGFTGELLWQLTGKGVRYVSDPKFEFADSS
jgi:hypothetical protein